MKLWAHPGYRLHIARHGLHGTTGSVIVLMMQPELPRAVQEIST
jgi:hypothetical protein